jgi:positive regulator of sigma E activity
MDQRIGTVISVIRNRVRIALPADVSRSSTDVAPSPCCRTAAGADSEEVEATSRVTVHSGDRVEVLVPTPRSPGAKLMPFIPAVGLPIAGAIVGGLLWGDPGTGIGIAVGLVLGFVLALLVSRRADGGSRDMARVLRIIGPAAPGAHCAACAASTERR